LGCFSVIVQDEPWMLARKERIAAFTTTAWVIFEAWRPPSMATKEVLPPIRDLRT
jgi:hypothetical protein